MKKLDKNNSTQIPDEFIGKLNCFFSAEQSVQQEITKNIISYLETEQHAVRLEQLDEKNSWWRRLLRLCHLDLSNKLILLNYFHDHLNTMVDTFVKEPRQQETNINLQFWFPAMLQILDKLQEEIDAHTSFWQRLLHWLCPQQNQAVNDYIAEVYTSTFNNLLTLSEENNNVDGNYREENLCLRIRQYINECETSYLGFFNKKENIRIANLFLTHMNDDWKKTSSILNGELPTINKVKQLRDFLAGIQAIKGPPSSGGPYNPHHLKSFSPSPTFRGLSAKPSELTS